MTTHVFVSPEEYTQVKETPFTSPHSETSEKELPFRLDLPSRPNHTNLRQGRFNEDGEDLSYTACRARTLNCNVTSCCCSARVTCLDGRVEESRA